MRFALLLTAWIGTLLLTACTPIQPVNPAAGPQSASPGLTFDPAARQGVLDNGLRYYVRANQEPANRAELWLVVDAGSTDEDEDQRGLAHFLEHMLFNGTEEYPATELVNFLESIGMEFGPDVNAYTSFDETVYTLQAPTDDAETLSRGLDVLKEWASAALVDPAEVDAERGVITEEWRMRDLNAGGRVSDEVIEALLGGTRYAERLPIGDMGIVATAPPESLRRYYETYYRPDNMAVIAVGDFAPETMEEQIRATFGGLTNPAAALADSQWDAPPSGETEARVISDPEFPATFVQLTWRLEPSIAKTEEDFRSTLVTDAVLQILNYRLEDLRRSANPPFLGAFASVGSLVRAADESSVGAQVEDGGVIPGLESLVAEVERLRRHGVTTSELERARTEMLRGFERAAAERENIANASHAEALREAFLSGSVPVSEEEAYRLAQELVPGITAGEVAARAQEIFPGENRLIFVVAPEKEEVPLPAEDGLLATLAEVEAREIEAPVEAAPVGSLLDELPPAAAILSTSDAAEVGAQVITLENGVTIWLKPTEFKDDEVLFFLSSPGGLSQVDDAEVVAAAYAPALASESGVGKLTQSDLQRALADKSVSVQPFVDNTSEGFSGQASPQDLESLLQLVYLYATEPRMDADALALFKRSIASYLTDRELDPNSAFEDRHTQIRCSDGSPRCDDIAALQEFADLDVETINAAYADRFANLGDATVVLVGNLDVEHVLPMLQRYLGNLPATGEAETAEDRIPPTPHRLFEESVEKGIDPSSRVLLSWESPLTATVDSRVAVRALENVLDIRVREVLREEMAAIYGAGVGGVIKPSPEDEYMLNVQFTVAPTRAVEAANTVLQIVEDVRANGPSEEVLSRAKQTLLSDHEENLELNDAWLAWLSRYVIDGEGPAGDILTIEDAIQSVTPEEIRTIAQQVLPADARIQLILYPEGGAEAN